MGYKGLTFGISLTLFAILIGIRNLDVVLQKRLENILQGLEKLENNYDVTVKPKVIVGYGVCIDVFVDARHLLRYSENIGNPQHHNEINTYEELLQGFAYFFRHGAAAERTVINTTLFDNLVSEALSVSSSYKMIGRNAALMSLRFFEENMDVILAAQMSKSLRQMFPKEFTIIGNEIDKDDVHLILEYKRGEVWGPYRSPRANRYIIHNDLHNYNERNFPLSQIDKILPTFKPDLFVVSGLQMMDNNPFPEGFRSNLLRKIHQQMLNQAPSTRIHFEMASFAEEKLIKDISNLIIPYSDSLGMNEQEIANLYNTFYFGNVSLVTDSSPRVAIILDQMRSVFKIIRQHQQDISNARKLTRIHVHTLAYQIIFTVNNGVWKNTAEAAAKASLTAHRYVCDSNDVKIDKAMLIMDESFSTSDNSGTRVSLDENKPVSCWRESFSIKNEQVDVNVCVAPVLVCTQVIKTAGGGDNISSAGLAPQI